MKRDFICRGNDAERWSALSFPRITWRYDLNWFQTSSLVAGSSVLAALVTQGIGWIRDRQKVQTDAALSALYLAIALESYANTCSKLISESELFDSSDEMFGSAHGNIEPLPNFSEDIDWKSLGITVAEQVMSFRVEVDTTRSMITGLWEFEGEEEIVPFVREKAAALGMKAIILAAEIRKAHQIRLVYYDDGEWSMKRHLEERYADYCRKREVREKRDSLFDAAPAGA